MKKTKDKYTQQGWLEQGRALFGDNVLEWEFVCPSCGQIQKPEDFLPFFKEESKAINIAYFNCIGRYNGRANHIFANEQPCNYTTGGLLNISPVTVIPESGEEIKVFDFNWKM